VDAAIRRNPLGRGGLVWTSSRQASAPAAALPAIDRCFTASAAQIVRREFQQLVLAPFCNAQANLPARRPASPLPRTPGRAFKSWAFSCLCDFETAVIERLT